MAKKPFLFDPLNLCKNYKNMKSLSEIKEVIEQITYKKGWRIEVFTDENRPMLQIIFQGEDESTGMVETQKCRKWSLSFHMTTTEIVYTALKAVQAAEDHETREFFKYKNVRIANPHFSVEDIVSMVNCHNLNEESRQLINK